MEESLVCPECNGTINECGLICDECEKYFTQSEVDMLREHDNNMKLIRKLQFKIKHLEKKSARAQQDADETFGELNERNGLIVELEKDSMDLARMFEMEGRCIEGMSRIDLRDAVQSGNKKAIEIINKFKTRMGVKQPAVDAGKGIGC